MFGDLLELSFESFHHGVILFVSFFDGFLMDLSVFLGFLLVFFKFFMSGYSNHLLKSAFLIKILGACDGPDPVLMVLVGIETLTFFLFFLN